MQFNLRGHDFEVKFSRHGDETWANLFEKDNSNYYYVGLVGRSVRKHNDAFNKSIGRKRALANLFKRMNETFVDTYKTTKKERLLIWEIYFKEHKK